MGQPYNISKTAWYYADDRSLKVVAEARTPAGDYIATTQAVLVLPREIVRAIKRHESKRAKRKSGGKP